MFVTQLTTTRIGVAGFTADYRELIEMAAANASRQLGCRVNVIWLAGKHREKVCARIVNFNSHVQPDTSMVEVRVNLQGASAQDLPALEIAFRSVLEQLA